MTPDPEDFFVLHRDFVLTFRESLLNINDAIEKKLGIFPTTSQIRREFKQAQQAKKLEQKETIKEES